MPRSAQNSGDSGPAGGGPTTTESSASSASALAGMGVQFLVAILLCLFAGRWLDTRLGTSPFLLILGVFLGAGASMFAMYRKVFPSEKPPAAPKAPGR